LSKEEETITLNKEQVIALLNELKELKERISELESIKEEITTESKRPVLHTLTDLSAKKEMREYEETQELLHSPEMERAIDLVIADCLIALSKSTSSERARVEELLRQKSIEQIIRESKAR